MKGSARRRTTKGNGHDNRGRNKEKFTKKEVDAAEEARRLYAIMGRP